MKTITTRKICQLTPIAALPSKPTYRPTMMWSTIPWAPPIRFWSMVGQASFQTAWRRGPSTRERAERRRDAPRAEAGTGGTAAEEEGPAAAGGAAASEPDADNGTDALASLTAGPDSSRDRRRSAGAG